MSKQPEALRLVDACDTLTNLGMLVPGLDTVECAAELRRLHLVEQALDRCRVVCDATSEGWRADAERWQAQRDALLAALKKIEAIEDKMFGSDWEEIEEARDISRAAIKQAEENT